MAEHVVGEQALPGGVGDDARRKAVGRVGAAVAILDEQFLAAEIVEKAGFQAFKLVGVEGLVHRSPTHLVLTGRFAHEEFVIGRAPGALAGVDDQRTMRGGERLAAPDDLFIQQRRGEVAVNLFGLDFLIVEQFKTGAGVFEHTFLFLVQPAGWCSVRAAARAYSRPVSRAMMAIRTGSPLAVWRK